MKWIKNKLDYYFDFFDVIQKGQLKDEFKIELCVILMLMSSVISLLVGFVSFLVFGGYSNMAAYKNWNSLDIANWHAVVAYYYGASIFVSLFTFGYLFFTAQHTSNESNKARKIFKVFAWIFAICFVVVLGGYIKAMLLYPYVMGLGFISRVALFVMIILFVVSIIMLFKAEASTDYMKDLIKYLFILFFLIPLGLFYITNPGALWDSIIIILIVAAVLTVLIIWGKIDGSEFMQRKRKRDLEYELKTRKNLEYNRPGLRHEAEIAARKGDVDRHKRATERESFNERQISEHDARIAALQEKIAFDEELKKNE